jgi:hypothetical protein
MHVLVHAAMRVWVNACLPMPAQMSPRRRAAVHSRHTRHHSRGGIQRHTSGSSAGRGSGSGSEDERGSSDSSNSQSNFADFDSGDEMPLEEAGCWDRWTKLHFAPSLGGWGFHAHVSALVML